MWSIINLTRFEQIYQNDDFFSFCEIISFLKSLNYWDINDEIIITNNFKYVNYITVRNHSDKSIKALAINNFENKNNNFTKIIFSLELMISMEQYQKINNTLRFQFPNVDFKRI